VFSGNTSEVVIFLGNGNGTFNLGGTYAAPNSTDFYPGSNSLYVADFNGDGKLDLAALTPYNGVFIFLGNGDGTFQTAVGYSTVDPNHTNDYTAYGMAVGDLNGDGKMDIAVTETSGMAVLLNNGNGTFGTATYYDSGIAPFESQKGIAIGDVNNDKRNDIVITDYYGNIVLYLNQGSGKFAVKGVVAKLGISPWLVSIADINGDKKMDLVVTDFAGEVWTFYGKGTGAFTAGPVYPLQWWEQAPSNVILADFNGDGALDIFKAGDHYWKGQVTLGRGDGTFQTNQAYGWGVTGFGQNLVTADFNGDGFPDVAFSWAKYTNLPAIGVMLGSSHGALAAPIYTTLASSACLGNLPEWIATGDVNGDGKADIVATIQDYSGTGCATEKVAVLMGLGTGKFSKPVFYSTGASAQSNDVFLADVNGDGKPDIVISNADGTISVLLNKGKGTFGTASLITSVAALSPHLNSLAIADFNGDGKLDIAVASYYPGSYSNNLYILLGNGDGTFQAPKTVAAGPQYSYTNTLAAGDFNKDGKMDLLITLEAQCSSSYHGSAAYAFLQGNGNGTFTASSPVCTGGDYPIYPVVGDFNGDGKLDAFIPMEEQYGTTSGPAMLEGNGDGTFNRIGEFYVGPTGRGAVVADFNGDGMPDIAVLNNNNLYTVDYVSFVTVMLNSTQPVSVSPLTLNFGSVAVGASKSLTVILTNNQSSTLTINSIAAASGTGDFTASSNCGTSRKAGWECTITVKFTPKALGAQTGTLTIKDSAGTQTVQLIAVNPKPAITSLSPPSATHGGAGFTLTVNGTGFISSSVVNWNGSPRATTYVSSTEVTATITAADIAKAGTFKVTVTTPVPGGGTSAAKTFTVN
jgi:FG-GAP-like repeat/Abnormal spindle-like microcephaly-assoc'd, ASPM-SPD-2-Hydin/FG-GAP repeat